MNEPKMLNRKLALLGDVSPSELRVAVSTVVLVTLTYIRSSMREGDLLSVVIVVLAAIGTLLGLTLKAAALPLIASGE